MEREEEIKQIAYYIWEQEGCCDGHDIEHWTRAEIIWKEKQIPAEAKPPEKPATVPRAFETKTAAEAQSTGKQAASLKPSGRKKSNRKRQ
jgi:hypothetical protein